MMGVSVGSTVGAGSNVTEADGSRDLFDSLPGDGRSLRLCALVGSGSTQGTERILRSDEPLYVCGMGACGRGEASGAQVCGQYRDQAYSSWR